MLDKKTAEIYGINGPVVTVKDAPQFMMKEMVFVGNEKLIGEVIAVHGDSTIIQVYEETSGLTLGEPVAPAGAAMSVTLGPGLLGNIFDGIERPLRTIKDESGAFISRGLRPDAVDMNKKWDVEITASVGDEVKPCSIIGQTDETTIIKHKIMVPPNVEGTISDIVKSGSYSCSDVIAKVKRPDGSEAEVKLVQEWPIRTPRPIAKREPIALPLITGQRIIDVLFPLAKGGTAAIPGGFGTGKTMTQHQLAKWSDADIIIYIGCGERGNEMTQVLQDFTGLTDPKSGQPLMNRTLLIANTSNMPVAAREASIYTGVTIAEYYRDMGYSVAVIADSTSRWAEALREMSGRLEEMPGEEGYPAYLTSRLAQFYERAGQVVCLGSGERRIGTLSAIGAVSPQGGDISEPVTQSTLRIVKVFWGLEANLAYRRHFPAINWLNSYSLYKDRLADWYGENVAPDWSAKVGRFMSILQSESSLDEIVKLVGMDALSPDDRLTMEVAQSVREDFLQQNAFEEGDMYTSLPKQYALISLILDFYDKASAALRRGADVQKIADLPVREKIGRAKSADDKKYKKIYADIEAELDAALDALCEARDED